MALGKGWNPQLVWAPLQRGQKGKEEQQETPGSLVALNIFHVIDLLRKSFIQQEEDMGDGEIWVQIQLQHLLVV